MGNNKILKTATAVALGTSVVATAVAPGAASAATTYKLKSGKLYQVKNGKTTLVKGFKTYKKVLYKNGKKYTGLRSAKYYKAGVLATGTYKGVKYKKGIQFTGVSANGKYYKNGVVGTGTYKGVKYKKGIKFAGVSTNGKLYEDGVVATGTKLVEDTLYVDGVVATGTVEFEDIVYVNGKKDVEAPVITAEDKTVAYGSEAVDVATLATVEDNSKEEIKATATITFDGKEVSAIDTKTPGKYTVTYVAKDKSGLETKKEIIVTVAEAEKAEVESVTAINATTVQVKFNKAVDAKDAEGDSTATANLAKYSIATVNPTEVTLSADGKTATLVFASSIEGENLAVVVDPIITAEDDNKKTARYAKPLTFADTTKPELATIKSATGTDKATTVELEFSEPISAAEAIKIDGKALVAGTNYTLAAGDTSLTLTGLDLDATKEHTIEIVNLADQAGTAPTGTPSTANVTSYINKTFTVTVDKTAPTVASVVPQNDNKLVVTFSKPVTIADGTVANTILGLVDADLVDKTSTLLTTSSTFTALDDTKTKYVVNLAATPFAGTATSANYTVKFLANTVVDRQGNKLAATTQNVSFVKDEVAPKLTNSSYRLDADGKVKELSFTFDEGVTFVTATTTGALTALLEDSSVNLENGVADNLAAVFGGSVPTGTFTVKNNVVTFALTTPVAVEGKYNFNVDAGKLKDTSLSATTNINKKSAFTLDFGTADAETTFKAVSATGTTGTVIPSTGDNTITVNYGIKVKGGSVAGSATDASAYKIGGKALPAGTTITLNSAQDTATIVIPAGSIATTDTNAVLTVEGVKSLDGSKTLVPYTKTINVIDNVAPTLTSATLTADNKLIVGFSEALSATPAATDLEVYINGHKVTTTPTPTAGSGSDAGKYIINLGAGTGGLLTFSTDTKLVIDGTNDITVATGSDVTSTYSLLSSSLINSVKVKVSNSTTLTDAATNGLTKGTEITVK